MWKQYYYPKGIMAKNKIQRMEIHFDNGESFSLWKDEIKEIDLNFYDKLEKKGTYFCKVAQSGYIKLNISLFDNSIFSSILLCDEKEYQKNRRRTLANRLLNGGISYFRVYDDNNWDEDVYGNFEVFQNDKEIILKAIEQPTKGKYSSKNFSINLYDLTKEIVDSIDIDFENCESFEVYNNEIKEINLKMNDRLDYGSNGYHRNIYGGYIKIRLDKNIGYRKNSLFNNYSSNKNDIKKILNRLSYDDHDICNLYITYKSGIKEHLTINEIDYREYYNKINYYEIDNSDKDDEDIEKLCIFGHTKKVNKYTFIIYFE